MTEAALSKETAGQALSIIKDWGPEQGPVRRLLAVRLGGPVADAVMGTLNEYIFTRQLWTSWSELEVESPGDVPLIATLVLS
jgi:hypothetical protein